jgi:hypothetical protein
MTGATGHSRSGASVSILASRRPAARTSTRAFLERGRERGLKPRAGDRFIVKAAVSTCLPRFCDPALPLLWPTRHQGPRRRDARLGRASTARPRRIDPPACFGESGSRRDGPGGLTSSDPVVSGYILEAPTITRNQSQKPRHQQVAFIVGDSVQQPDRPELRRLRLSRQLTAPLRWSQQRSRIRLRGRRADGAATRPGSRPPRG